MNGRNEWIPQYSPWRHGGWYVDNVRYPDGSVGCVSRNFADRRWRIVCGDMGVTYASRDAAAHAERDAAAREWSAVRASIAYATYRMCADALPREVAREVSRNAHIVPAFRVALIDALKTTAHN